jgi:oligopeptide/dipeptide ABC transporter ATP-binding protein
VTDNSGLELNNLTVKVKNAGNDEFYVLRNVSFLLKAPEVLGILGESGSGKSILAKEVCGLNSYPVKKISGDVSFDGKVLSMEKDYAGVRGKQIAMIFQHPTSALNPVITIGKQMTEILLHHKTVTDKKAAAELVASILEETGIDHSADRMLSYPHQLSGGMNQRVMIAMAISTQPRLMIADEPTTALDVITQEQIIKLLSDLGKKKDYATLFITHNISLMQKIADRVLVLYAGEMMEILTGKSLSAGKIKHPCTIALKECLPTLSHIGSSLPTIPGQIARNDERYDNRCVFYERCMYTQPRCKSEKPDFIDGVRCFYPL